MDFDNSDVGRPIGNHYRVCLADARVLAALEVIPSS
jgi:hypothetical protein